MSLLPRSWYERSTVQVAQDLLGAMIVRTVHGTRMSGIIIETEAYRADDPACHAFRGQTARNTALFGPVGHTYVYFTYGIHFCMNIVAREQSLPAGGVLIRALQPIDGIDTMMLNRPGHPVDNLMSGPGKLTQALAIADTKLHYDVTQPGDLYITKGIQVDPHSIKATPRIGISAGKDLLWRFVLPQQAQSTVAGTRTI